MSGFDRALTGLCHTQNMQKSLPFLIFNEWQNFCFGNAGILEKILKKCVVEVKNLLF